MEEYAYITPCIVITVFTNIIATAMFSNIVDVFILI